jgi:hypothetical protein
LGGPIKQVLAGSAGVASAKLDLAVQVCKKLRGISKRYAFPQMGWLPLKVVRNQLIKRIGAMGVKKQDGCRSLESSL